MTAQVSPAMVLFVNDVASIESLTIACDDGLPKKGVYWLVFMCVVWAAGGLVG